MTAKPHSTPGTIGIGSSDIQLRSYQTDAIMRLTEVVNSGVQRVLIVAPTGSGKTTIAGHIITSAIRSGRSALFLAHRRELISQAYHRLLDFGLPEAQVGVLMAEDPRRRPGAVVQVASVDTLRNRAKPKADVVFVDEAHRALARTYKDIANEYQDAIHLGLTATPYRADGRGLDDAYDALVVVSSPKQLIEQGYLVEPRVFTVPLDSRPDLSSIRIRRGDYDESQLSALMNSGALVGNIVEHWLSHASGVRTVCFATSIAHSKHITERFCEAGIPAEHLDGTTPLPERDGILARLDSGETLITVNVGILQEGWDQPSVKCAILARPTTSTGLYLQQAGRILRPYNDQQAIILDHAGCVLEHGLPHDDRQFSLHIPKRKRKKGEIPEAPVRTCPECYAILPIAVRCCPECGHEFEVVRQLPKETEDQLIEVTPDKQALKAAKWAQLQAIAHDRGYKSGWAYYRFKEQFGHKPPRSRINRAGGNLRATLRDAARNQKGHIDWSQVTGLDVY